MNGDTSPETRLITHISLFSFAFIDRCLYICLEVFNSTLIYPVPMINVLLHENDSVSVFT